MWINSRDCYRRSIRRRAQGQNVRLWKHEKEMTFLLPFLQLNVDEQGNDCSLTSQDETIKDFEEILFKNEEQPMIENVEVIEPLSSAPSQGTEIFNNMEDITKNTIPKVKRKRQEELLSSVLINRLLQTTPETPQKDDELTLFFNAMCATVKKLNLISQYEAKTKIFKIVSELELKHLQSEEYNSCQNYTHVENQEQCNVSSVASQQSIQIAQSPSQSSLHGSQNDDLITVTKAEPL